MATKCVMLFVSFCCFFLTGATQSIQPNQAGSSVQASKPTVAPVSRETASVVNSCTCGIFLSDQFVRGSPKPPTGNAAIYRDIDEQVTCNALGVKQCTTRCIENLVSFLPKGDSAICASIDRDVLKQRAYLFVNNCNRGWYNTKFSAGREYCCKNGEFYKCPL